jgi:hypothetical protein
MGVVLLTVVSLVVAVVGCQAAEPGSAPATQPATLQATLAVAPHDNMWIATITWTNPTDHGLSLGRYTSFSLSRVDVTPAVTVASSPPGGMAPHFRVLLPAGSSQTSTVTLYRGSAPLPGGKYQATIVFPKDILPEPLQTEFTIPLAASTQP